MKPFLLLLSLIALLMGNTITPHFLDEPASREITLSTTINEPFMTLISYRSPAFYHDPLYQNYGLSFAYQYDSLLEYGFAGKLFYSISPWKQIIVSATAGTLFWGTPHKSEIVPVDIILSSGINLTPNMGDHRIGIGLFNGSNVPISGFEYLLEPRSISGNWSGRFANGHVVTNATVGLYTDSRAIKYKIGASVHPWLFILGGLLSDRQSELHCGWAPRFGKELELLFSWKSYRTEFAMGELSLRKEFGKSREESYAQKMGRTAGYIPPSTFWAMAKQLYQDRKTFDALAVGEITLQTVRLLDFSYNLVDTVLTKIFIAQCLFDLQFDDAANLIVDTLLENHFQEQYVIPITYLQKNQYDHILKEENHSIQGTINCIDMKCFYEIGEKYLRKNLPLKAIKAFSQVINSDSLQCLAERGIATAKALLNSNETYEMCDTTLIALYDSARIIHNQIGLRVLGLMQKSQYSSVIQELDSLKVICDRNLALFGRYEAAWDEEKNRVIKMGALE